MPRKKPPEKAPAKPATKAAQPKKEVSRSTPKPRRRTPRPATPEIPAAEIALRAYYIAERRQRMGWPGDETSDWVLAEQQLVAEAKEKPGSPAR